MFGDLTILLPAYNEEQGIGQTIDDIRRFVPDAKIWIEDGGSKDKTYEVCLSKNIVPDFGNWLGKGEAVSYSLKRIVTPYVIMMDSDFTYPAQWLPVLYNILKSGANVVAGYRYTKEEGSMSYLNSFGNSVLSVLASLLYLKPIQDVCTGMWGFDRKFLDSLNIKSKGFTLEAELLVNTIKGKFIFIQIPISYRKRLDGSISKLKLSDGLKIGVYLIQGVFRNG